MTTLMKQGLARLDEPESRDPAFAGHKAATLASLTQEGWRVPDGFVIGVDACAVVAKDSEMPEELRTRLNDELDRLGDVPVAVRSSGVAEDLPEASFAGQYESHLNVQGVDEVCRAVLDCVASASSDRVESYRQGHGNGNRGIAVLIQIMVPADSAGIAFSANPITGDRDEVIVNAVAGLGDRLATGEATPEEWVVRNGEVKSPSAPANSIDSEMAARIAGMATDLESQLGTPQDIEWAVTGGELFLLQSRPITALPIEPDLEVPDDGTWTKDVAHYPEAMSPFGASVYLPALDAGIRNMCSEFGLLVEGVDNVSLGGEVYGKVTPVGGKEGPPPPWWLMGVLTRVVPPLRERVKAARGAIESGSLEELPRRWEEEWRDAFKAEIEERRSVDLESLTDDEMIEELEKAKDLLHRGQLLHFRLFIPYVVGVHRLVEVSERLLGWTTDETMRLLSGLSEASSEPARELERLAQRIRNTPGAADALKQCGTDVERALGEVDTELADQVAEYRHGYGFRAVGYDPGSPTIGERPSVFARNLKQAVASDDEGQSPDEIRAEAEAEARSLLEEREESAVADLEEALEQARAVYYLREDNILWTDNVPNAVIRRVTLEIGRRLAARGQLLRREDVSFLKRDELIEALSGDSDLKPIASQRRAEQAWVAAHPGPPYHGPEPAPMPDLRAIPEDARQINQAFMFFMSQEYDTSEVEGEGLPGIPGSSGTYTGPVRVIRSEKEFEKLSSGDVLVCRVTTPVWSVLFGTAGAVVTDGGGALSHAAIVAREHGIPAVLGTGVATSELSDGQSVTVDGTHGKVIIED